MASHSDTILLFNDHPGDILEYLRSSKSIVHRSVVGLFFQRSMSRLQRRISESSLSTYDSIASESPFELALVSKGDMSVTATAVNTALLCLAQFTDVIRHLETSPRAFENVSGNRLILLGVSTGTLTAAAVSCCKNLEDVLCIADGVVELAFNLGLEAAKRSAYLEPIPSTNPSYTWATYMPSVNVTEICNAIDAQVVHHQARVYASVIGTSSMTVNGPPSSMEAFFLSNHAIKSSKMSCLAVNAAFHAGHLCQIPVKQITRSASPRILGMSVQHPFLMSSNSGDFISGKTFGDLLETVINDALQLPVIVDALIGHLDKSQATKTAFIAFGPQGIGSTTDQLFNMYKQRRKNYSHMNGGLNQPAQPCSVPPADPGDIAIIGMGVRLPGSETLEELWSVLDKGLDLHRPVPPDRFDLSAHYDPDGIESNTSHTKYGVFIERPGYFDRHLFHMSPREALQTDPQQRLLLLATYEALEMAGYSPDRLGGFPGGTRTRVGSFIGQTGDDWREVNSSQNIDTYFIPGGMRAFGPGKLHYHFGWDGPSYSIDTACSSSAASIQLAYSALLARECDMAIAGGVNFLSAPDVYAGLSRGGFLSPSGGCKTFDDAADGYCRADAVGVVVLKRLSEAIRQRDPILAVVRNAITNHSAEAISITHPHAETQKRLFSTILARSGLRPSDINYVEMHGTGTQAGDACEMSSVIAALAENCRSASNYLYIGSIKPNLGHGEGGSGVTSLIKAVLILQKSRIPPHVGIKNRINRKFPNLDDVHVRIANSSTPFPAQNSQIPRRIMINNFDAAGGNTSIIIEDPPQLVVTGSDCRSYHVITLSGKTKTSALQNARRLLMYAKKHPGIRVEDLAYTTTARRPFHHTYRLTFVESDYKKFCQNLEQTIAEDDSINVGHGLEPTIVGDDSSSLLGRLGEAASPKVIFAFTGQGCHYISMASGLYEMFPQFRESLESMAQICNSYGFASFMPLITQANNSLDLSQASPVQVQTGIVAIELAIVGLWRDHGITPDAVIGHSLGDLPALCTAGVISMATCLYLTGYRASLIADRCTPGTHAMLALNRSAQFVETYLNPSPKHCIGSRNGNDSDLAHREINSCEVACVNSDQSTVISGPVKEIDALRSQLNESGVSVSILDIPFAFHSSQMDVILDDYEKEADRVNYMTPQIPIASTRTGKVITNNGAVNASYLRGQTRDRVQFSQALHSLIQTSSLAKSSRRIWFEIGPRPICLSFIRAGINSTAKHKRDILLPSMKKGEDNCKTFAYALAMAHQAGVRINWTAHHKPYEHALRLLELPSYAFDLQNYWIQYEGDWSQKKGRTTIAPTPQPYCQASSLYKVHDTSVDNHEISVTLAADISDPRLSQIIRGHKVNGNNLCPSSVYTEMALSATQYIQGLQDPGPSSNSKRTLCMDVRDMEVSRPLILGDNTQQLVYITAVRDRTSQTARIHFSSQVGTTKLAHAKCEVVLEDGRLWQSNWEQVSCLVQDRISLLTSKYPPRPTNRVLRSMAYRLFAALVMYDTQYQGMEEVYFDSEMLEATAKIRFQTHADNSFYLHPCWIDSLAHISGFVLNGTEATPSDTVYISHGWKSIKIAVSRLSAHGVYQSYVRMKEDPNVPGTMIGDVYILEDNDVIAFVQEIRFRRIKRFQLEDLLPSGDENGHKLSRRYETGPNASLSASINSTTIRQGLQGGSERKREPTRAYHEQISEIDAVLNIIAEEAGMERSCMSDHILLADLGIDSLLSLNIAARVPDILGRKLPPSLILGSASIADLRSNLTRHFSLANSNTEYEVTSIPSIQASITNGNIASFEAKIHLLRSPSSSSSEVGPGRTLFLLPDGAGYASSYIQFAAEGLGETGLETIYGLDSPFAGVSDGSAWDDVTLGDIVTSFVRCIRNVQPRGPYHLGGWSIGGIYAFEAAAQLRDVSSLFLIDPPRIPSSINDAAHSVKYKCETTRDLIDIANLVHPNHHKPPLDPRKHEFDSLQAHFTGSMQILDRHHLSLLRTSEMVVTLIWATRGVLEALCVETKASPLSFINGNGTQNSASDWVLHPRNNFGPNGWDMLLPNIDIKCHTVEGDHFSIMRRPGIQQIAGLWEQSANFK